MLVKLGKGGYAGNLGTREVMLVMEGSWVREVMLVKLGKGGNAVSR